MRLATTKRRKPILWSKFVMSDSKKSRFVKEQKPSRLLWWPNLLLNKILKLGTTF